MSKLAVKRQQRYLARNPVAAAKHRRLSQACNERRRADPLKWQAKLARERYASRKLSERRSPEGRGFGAFSHPDPA